MTKGAVVAAAMEVVAVADRWHHWRSELGETIAPFVLHGIQHLLKSVAIELDSGLSETMCLARISLWGDPLANLLEKPSGKS